jgi:DNA repair exonuclease SbcCD nuclease subunit
MMFTSDGYGEDEETGYMPVRLSYFAGLGIDYILAGHFHSNFSVHAFDGGFFVYPGSPVSHSRKETGVRSVNLFETGSAPSPIPLDTPYFEQVTVDLDPFGGLDPLEAVRRAVAGADPRARLLVEINGLVDLGRLGLNESEFAEAVGRVLPERAGAPAHEWSDVSRVVEDPLFVRSMSALDSKGLGDERRESVRRMIIRALMEAGRAD